jgi:hypothetical protein
MLGASIDYAHLHEQESDVNYLKVSNHCARSYCLLNHDDPSLVLIVLHDFRPFLLHLRHRQANSCNPGVGYTSSSDSNLFSSELQELLEELSLVSSHCIEGPEFANS